MVYKTLKSYSGANKSTKREPSSTYVQGARFSPTVSPCNHVMLSCMYGSCLFAGMQELYLITTITTVHGLFTYLFLGGWPLFLSCAHRRVRLKKVTIGSVVALTAGAWVRRVEGVSTHAHTHTLSKCVMVPSHILATVSVMGAFSRAIFLDEYIG